MATIRTGDDIIQDIAIRLDQVTRLLQRCNVDYVRLPDGCNDHPVFQSFGTASDELERLRNTMFAYTGSRACRDATKVDYPSDDH